MNGLHRKQIEELIQDWVFDRLPVAQDSRGVRIAVGSDHLAFDRNCADFWRGSSYEGPVGIRFNGVTILNEGYCEKIKTDHCLILPAEKVLTLRATILNMRQSPIKKHLRMFRLLLAEHADLVPISHKNHLITRFRIQNAMEHHGRMQAVTFVKDDDVDDGVVFVRWWPTIEDAIIHRLAHNNITALELGR